MKKRNLVKTTSSGLALFILIIVLLGRAAAAELSNAAESSMEGDTAASAAIQSLQQSFAQQRELMAIQKNYRPIRSQLLRQFFGK